MQVCGEKKPSPNGPESARLDATIHAAVLRRRRYYRLLSIAIRVGIYALILAVLFGIDTASVFFYLLLVGRTYGTLSGLLVVGLSVLWADWPRALRVMAIGAVLLFATNAVTEVGKQTADRVRPARFITDFESKVSVKSREEGERSFPSGHATAAFCLYATMAKFYPRTGPLFLVLAVLCAISRVLLLKHYPSDVFAGALVGYYVAKWLIRTGVFDWIWPEGWPRWPKAKWWPFGHWRKPSNGKT